MKHIKRIISVLLVTLLIAGIMPTSAFATSDNTPKEEVVYINLNADGSVKEINVVNIFELDTDGKIVDYGRYESVRNMTSTDKLGYAKETVTVDAKAGKLYYEGKLSSKVMPWNIAVKYFMDGKEYTASEAAGKSGNLKITMNITENTECIGNFFEGYALQASLSLDTKKFRNINALDATIANIGSSKQLTYTILPGKGADVEITAEVSEFELDGISVNGLPLNLNIAVDDSDLMEQVTKLLDAIEKLDNGTGELQSGVSDLQNGVRTELHGGIQDLKDGAVKFQIGCADLKNGGSDLQNGTGELYGGVIALDDGIASLKQGVGRIQSALSELSRQASLLTNGSAEFNSALRQLQSALSGISVTADDLTALTGASSAIKSGIGDLVNGIAALKQNISFEAFKSVMGQNGLDIDVLRQNNTAAISNLQRMIQELSTQSAAMSAAGADTSAIDAQISQLQNIMLLLGANNASIDGTEAYLTTVNGNLSELLHGAQTLQSSYAAFIDRIGELANMLNGMNYQMSELSAAVNTLVSEYDKLDQGISEYTGTLAQIVAGYTQISDGTKQLAVGSSELRTGSAALYEGTSELLSGIVEMYNATGTLKDGTGTLDRGVQELLAGIAQLCDGTGELKYGTSSMREETSGMDTTINNKIDDLLESVTGGDMKLCSFVSEQNENIKSVQFVIKTEGIHPAENAVKVKTEPVKLNFWQKLLKLFGLYHED